MIDIKLTERNAEVYVNLYETHFMIQIDIISSGSAQRQFAFLDTVVSR